MVIAEKRTVAVTGSDKTERRMVNSLTRINSLLKKPFFDFSQDRNGDSISPTTNLLVSCRARALRMPYPRPEGPASRRCRRAHRKWPG
jgi:hypothetical protein